MASSLQRLTSNSGNANRSALTPLWRAFSTEDSLVEIKPGEVGMVSGIPEEHLRRRMGNPLMGWTSTGDPYANVGDAALSFDSKEAAIEFAERHGWEYTVKKQQTPLLKAKSYADNFKWKGPPKEDGN